MPVSVRGDAYIVVKDVALKEILPVTSAGFQDAAVLQIPHS
jgi:hypothetical protein